MGAANDNRAQLDGASLVACSLQSCWSVLKFCAVRQASPNSIAALCACLPLVSVHQPPPCSPQRLPPPGGMVPPPH